MKFKFFCLDVDANRADFINQTDNPALVTKCYEAVHNALRKGAEAVGGTPKAPTLFPPKRGPKGRTVIVVGKEPDSEAVLVTGDVFPCARDASEALGFNYNAVALALNNAARKREETVVIQGVELRYADTLGGE